MTPDQPHNHQDPSHTHDSQQSVVSSNTTQELNIPDTENLVPKSKSGYIDPDERVPTGSNANAQTAEEIMVANNFLGDLS